MFEVGKYARNTLNGNACSSRDFLRWSCMPVWKSLHSFGDTIAGRRRSKAKGSLFCPSSHKWHKGQSWVPSEQTPEAVWVGRGGAHQAGVLLMGYHSPLPYSPSFQEKVVVENHHRWTHLVMVVMVVVEGGQPC